MELYRWQRECLDIWHDNGCRGIVHVVTGAGKTRFALEAIDDMVNLYPDIVVRIVVPTIPLAYQWKKVLLHHVSSEALRPGFFGGGRRDDPVRKMMIYIINSARDSLARHIRRDMALNHPVLLICDECHHYQSRENRKIFDFLTPEIRDSGLYFSLGLSATPFGTNHDKVLIRSLGRRIYQYDFNDAVKDGVISPFTVCEVSTSFFPIELQEYTELSDRIGALLKLLLSTYPKLADMGKTEFMKTVTAIAHEADMDPEEPAVAFLLLTWQRKEISTLASARVACAISLIEKLSGKDRILVFCERISQAEDMAGVVRSRFGNICGIYHSEMTKEARTRVLTEFRNGESRILVSCRCLDEGIDVPDANIGIVLSSSAVERQRIQRLGRVVRRSSGKAAACLYYIYIRESSDDAAYLTGLENYDSFSLRYYTAENEFSNDLYEYAAGVILKRGKRKGYSDAEYRELRHCLSEGLTRADFLLPYDLLEEYAKAADRIHEKNYWYAAKKVGEIFRD